MENITSLYKDNELGWVSQIFSISVPSDVVIKLKNKGRVIVKKGNGLNKELRKVLVTPITGPEFNIKVEGEVKGKLLQINTSEEPESITVYGGAEATYYLKVTPRVIYAENVGDIRTFDIQSNTQWKIEI